MGVEGNSLRNKDLYKIELYLLKVMPMLLAAIYLINTVLSYYDIANPEETMQVMETIKGFVDKEQRLSKYEACRYLNISRATFDNYVREGKLPKGQKQAGFKELSWSYKDLNDAIKRLRK